MTIAEAAEFLHVSRSHLYSLVSRKAIPAGRVGKAYRFVKSDLVEHLRKSYAVVAYASANEEEVKPCQSSNVVKYGGSRSCATADEYASLLGLPTKGKRNNSTT